MTLRELEDRLLQDADVQLGYDNASAAAKMGVLLRKLRERGGLTQREVFVASGVQQSEISRYEAGQATRGLTLSQLQTIAHAQGVEVVIGFAQMDGPVDDNATVIDGRTLLMHTLL